MSKQISKKVNIKKRSKSFPSVSNAQELMTYLSSTDRDKDELHHYTTIDRLDKMIKSGYFIFSSSGNMNDQNEFNRHNNHHKDIFAGCFSRDSDENIAMWGMYSIPWEIGVRISIPTKSLKKWIRSNGVMEASDNYEIGNPIERASYTTKLINVCYVNQTNTRLSWSDRRLYLRDKPELINWESNSELVEYIKDEAWRYEAEVRLLIATSDNLPRKRVAIPIDDEFVSTWKITLGPKFSDKISHFEINQHMVVRESRFKNLIIPKMICENCIQKEFKFKD